MSTIAENVASIREKMAEAAKQAGRDPESIRLCAATKMNDAAAVREAIAAGVELLRREPRAGNSGKASAGRV